MGRKTNDEVILLDKKEYVLSLWNDLLLSVLFKSDGAT